jgi:pimeloyl-ACP methyl ester carboxylesterase
MPLLANGLTESKTSRSFHDENGMLIHYHDIGQGEPVVFLHAYGPGSTAWLTWYKAIGEFAKHFRCLLLDLVNYGKTGPEVYKEPSHSVQARAARKLIDHAGVPSAMFVGLSIGGTTSLVEAIEAPERVKKIVVGGSHASTGGDPYIIARTYANPTREQFVRYLKVHLYDEKMATDPELVDYVFNHWTNAKSHQAAQSKSVSVSHSNLGLLHDIRCRCALSMGDSTGWSPLSRH